VLDLFGSGGDPDEAVESIQLRFHHEEFHLASHVTVSVLVTPYNMHLQPVLTFIFVSVCHARVQLQDIKKLDIVVNCCRLSILLASSLIFSWKSPSSHSSFSSPGDQAKVKKAGGSQLQQVLLHLNKIFLRQDVGIALSALSTHRRSDIPTESAC
jgi:hypothetical protein